MKTKTVTAKNKHQLWWWIRVEYHWFVQDHCNDTIESATIEQSNVDRSDLLKSRYSDSFENWLRDQYGIKIHRAGGNFYHDTIEVLDEKKYAWAVMSHKFPIQ